MSQEQRTKTGRKEQIIYKSWTKTHDTVHWREMCFILHIVCICLWKYPVCDKAKQLVLAEAYTSSHLGQYQVDTFIILGVVKARHKIRKNK